MSENKELESQLREDWKKWNNNAHPEDEMPFIDYVEEVDQYKGHRVKVDTQGWDCKILFS